jgi:hypothetical protein
VCLRLGVSPAWLARHRNLFEWIQIPGRGVAGLEYRYSRVSVETFASRGVGCKLDSLSPFAGKTVAEITQIMQLRSTALGGWQDSGEVK